MPFCVFCFNDQCSWGCFQVSLKGQVCFSLCLPFIWWVAGVLLPPSLRLLSLLTSVLFFEVDSGYFIIWLFRKIKRFLKNLWIYIPSCYWSLPHPNIWVNKKCICIFQPFLCTVIQWNTQRGIFPPAALDSFQLCFNVYLCHFLLQGLFCISENKDRHSCDMFM